MASLAYWSWPLGYILNRPLVVSGLASDLEVHGQPYYWLFIGLDCITGAMAVVGACAAQAGRRGVNARGKRWALCAYASFGLATAVDALVPLQCASSTLASCGADLSSLNIDDLLTGLAMASLFIAAVCALAVVRRQRAWARLEKALVIILVSWSACGLDLFTHHFTVQPAVGLQHLMLTLTSVVALLTMLVIVRRTNVRVPLTSENSTLRKVKVSAR